VALIVFPAGEVTNVTFMADLGCPREWSLKNGFIHPNGKKDGLLLFPFFAQNLLDLILNW
jgi:hypothetical protein